MIQWLLDFGVSYDTIVVIVDTLSPGDLCMVGFHHTEDVL